MVELALLEMLLPGLVVGISSDSLVLANLTSDVHVSLNSGINSGVGEGI